MAAPSTSSDLRVAEVVFHEWCARSERGPIEDLDALCALHPRHADELRRLDAARRRGLSLIERLAGAAPADDGPPIELAPADAGPAEPTRGAERYAYEGEIGRGGMGVVLRVRDRVLGRPLAMKVARVPGEGSSARRRVERLAAEARVQSRLDHPGILPVHELGLGADGTLYFTMPLVRGRGLDAILEEHRAGSREWTLPRIAGLLLRVCEAVTYAHHQGVVHRDLKPSNVMVGGFGETYVTDWGLARAVGVPDERDLRLSDGNAGESPLLTREGDVVGTPAYMPPEQAAGALEEVDARADVYSIGAMLYELLAGARPYGEQSPLRVLQAVRAGPPTPLVRCAPRAPEELVSVCERAMARDPARRYAAASALAEDLRAWLEGRVVRAHATGPAAELRKWIGRNRLTAAAAAAALVATIGGLVIHTRTVSRAAAELAAGLYRTDVALATAALSSGDTAPLAVLLERAPAALRGWEWRYLARLTDVSGTVLRGGGDGFHALAVAPDGGLVAVGDGEGVIRVWDPRDGRPVARFAAMRGPVRELAFAEDSRTLGATGDARALELFDARDGAPLAHGAEVARDYATLEFQLERDVAAAGRYDGQVELYAARSGAALGVLAGVHDDGIECVEFTPDGALVLTSGRDGRVAVWSLADRTCLRSWRAHEGWVRSLAVSPDGRRVASGSSDGAAAVWSVETGARVAELPRDAGTVFSLAWSADGARLATAGGPSIRVWDTRDWRERARLVGHSSRVVGLAFLPGGRTLASIERDDELRLSELARSEARLPLPGHDGDVEAACFLAGGARVASGGRDGRIVLRRFEDGAVLARRELDTAPLFALAAQPGTDVLVAAGDSGRIERVAPDDLAPLGGFAHGPRVHELGFLDAERLLVCDAAGALSMRRMPDGELVWRRALDETALVRLCLDPLADLLATAALDGSVHFCRASTGAPLRELRATQTGGVALALSPGGRRLAIGERHGIRVLRCSDWSPVRTIGAFEHGAPLAWLPDGTRLLGGGIDGSLTLWDPRTGERIASFPGHRETWSALALSADGQRLVTGSFDDTLRLWDARPLARTGE